MNRLLKVLLGVVAGVVALIVVAVILVAVFFNANDYRDQIAAKVQQTTGRTLKIGAIHLSVFPTLGLKLSNTEMGNARGFGDTPFAAVGEADVGVRLLPLLLHRKLEVGTVYLSNLKLDLQKNAAGVSNWADLTKPGSSSAPQPAVAKSTSGSPLAALDVNGVNIDNAAIHYRDAQAKRDITLDGFNLSLDALRPGTPCAFRTRFKTQINQPAVKADVQASGKLSFDLAAQHYQLQDFMLQLAASGKGLPAGAQTVKLAGDVDYDGAKGSAHLADVRLNAAGVTAHVSVQANGIGGDKLRYSGPLKVDTFNPREVMDTLGLSGYRSADADVLKQASLDARFSGTTHSAAVQDLKLKLDQTNASGSLDVSSFAVPALSAALKIDAIDVDRYLPTARAADSNGTAPKGSAGNGDDTLIPVKALDGFTAKAKLDIGKLTLHGVKMSDITVSLNAVKGQQKNLALDAKLYGGSIASTTQITPAAQPGYRTHLKLVNVDAAPLMKDATGKAPISGRGDISADLSSTGRTVGQVKRALDGNVAIKFDNGAINGFNLGKILRGLQSMQQNGAQAVASGGSTSSAQTDFTSLSASGQIKNGVMTSNDLAGASPLLRLAGAGTVDLVQQTLDYTIKPTVVNTATGQGGKNLDQLRGIEIPVNISGPFSAPKYRVDVAAALKQKATQKLRDTVDKEKGKLQQKLQDKLKGLFGN